MRRLRLIADLISTSAVEPAPNRLARRTFAAAAMAERTVVEWDKDDLDALGILKIDVLALGMLTCIRKAFELIERHDGRRWTLATLPAEDPAVYAMLSCAASIGVFQVESRAQMTMLPRLKPRGFYDLVIEVAIVRPGPIQGDMVHPYLRRRNGEEKVDYPSEDLRAVLGKTLGVPLFQEQAMKIAIVAAGFTPSEADRLRGGAPFASPWPTDDLGLSRADRRELQCLLAARGHDVGAPSRVLTPPIRSAVKEEQQRLGHEATGRPGQRLLKALRDPSPDASLSCGSAAGHPAPM